MVSNVNLHPYNADALVEKGNVALMQKHMTASLEAAMSVDGAGTDGAEGTTDEE